MPSVPLESQVAEESKAVSLCPLGTGPLALSGGALSASSWETLDSNSTPLPSCLLRVSHEDQRTLEVLKRMPEWLDHSQSQNKPASPATSVLFTPLVLDTTAPAFFWNIYQCG